MSKVRNLTIRYTLRLLGTTFLARPRPYTTTTVELGFIYEPLRYWLHDASDAPGHDHGIAIDLQDFEELPTAYMDEEYMVETKTCAGRFNEVSFMYSFMDERMVPQCCFVPNPKYSHNYSNDGIRFRIPQHICFEVPYPRNQNPKRW
ncbi:unnamed protein product [Cochlearia groenlandica]